MEKEKLEKYSSAITLSDMEIFVFPELMYSLVLANMMSPEIWKWRQLETFEKIADKSPYRRLMRLRQFIMDEYEFNLDLDTWGLTDKQTELERFAEYISPEQIAQSNALFGYHGDEYYFDIGIRKHFGLDKYTTDIIPYWKTETIEAMNAFRFKQGYTTGAGECVSLSALYMAAAFIVCDIPLSDMYMILTPLHSQNFIDISDGVICNNRRVLTKAMWFNGTEITSKSQRALRNESVTIVAHNTGYIHCLYDEATIAPAAYESFKNKLGNFLQTDLDLAVFANFLRENMEYRKNFVFCRHHRGQHKFVNSEILFAYEHGSSFRIAQDTYDKLLAEVSEDDFIPFKPQGRVCVEEFTRYMRKSSIDILSEIGREKLVEFLSPFLTDAREFVNQLIDFMRIEPALPSDKKTYIAAPAINIQPGMTRDELIDYLYSVRCKNPVADLAVYAYRDMANCDWEPFLVASLERSPVSIEKTSHSEIGYIYDILSQMDNQSIYDSQRLAHPDEVINYMRGDGVEKAITLANIILARDFSAKLLLTIDTDYVRLDYDGHSFEFSSTKDFRKQLALSKNSYRSLG